MRITRRTTGAVKDFKASRITTPQTGIHGFFLTRYSKERLRNHFEAVTRRAVDRILRSYPRVVAIGVDGSVGRRTPLPYSDVDLFVLVRGNKPPDPLYYIDDGCYVGVGFSTLKPRTQRGMDFFWAGGGSRSARILYDPAHILKKKLLECRKTKPSPAIVDEVLFEAYTNLIEYAGKLRNGRLSSDEYLVRYAARIIGGRAEEVVMALNDISPLSENIVWHLVMKARKKPVHFRLDYPIARGHAPASAQRVFTSALRLAEESLRLIKDTYAARARSKNFRSLLRDSLDKIGL